MDPDTAEKFYEMQENAGIKKTEAETQLPPFLNEPRVKIPRRLFELGLDLVQLRARSPSLRLRDRIGPTGLSVLPGSEVDYPNEINPMETPFRDVCCKRSANCFN